MIEPSSEHVTEENKQINTAHDHMMRSVHTYYEIIYSNETYFNNKHIYTTHWNATHNIKTTHTHINNNILQQWNRNKLKRDK